MSGDEISYEENGRLYVIRPEKIDPVLDEIRKQNREIRIQNRVIILMAITYLVVGILLYRKLDSIGVISFLFNGVCP